MPDWRFGVLLRKLLEYRRLPFVLAVLALLMTLPALRMGLLNDDWHHWGVLAGTSRLGQDLSRLGIAPEGS